MDMEYNPEHGYKASRRDEAAVAVCNWILLHFVSLEYRSIVGEAYRRGMKSMREEMRGV